ncbi:unnamed protein product, partial [marine sediment metagenome]
MKTDVATCLKDIADWYIKNRTEMPDSVFETIVLRHCESEAEVINFLNFLETEPGKMRFKTLLREMKESEPQPYLEKYRKLVEKYPDRIDNHLERAKDEKASLVLGRGFGESFDDYLEHNPSVKRRWDELTTAIGEMEQLKAGIIGTIKPQATKGSKEPWQMTRAEYVKPPYTSPAMHKYGVQKALSEGKPVPAEVLKDYPDLAKVAPVTPEIPKIPEARLMELKRHEELVLRAVRDKPNITMPELEQVTKLEPVQIDGAIRRLGEGTIIKTEGKMTPGGLMPSSYRLTPEAVAIPEAVPEVRPEVT